jgi:PDZ domain-containing secreted protein/Zn-dependent protease/CBS domain-containing protein
MESSFTFLKLRGIPVGAHWSWVLVFGLVVWSLGTSLFPSTYPGLGTTTYLVMGGVAGVLFFLSILLHELGHAFRALEEGMKIEGITLWLFGGVARFRGMFPSAGAEFRVAIAGPVVSLGLVAVFAVVGLPEPSSEWARATTGIADYLARINAILVGFNLVPALPLDGGRVLRAWLWARQKSYSSATLSAARAGKAFGGLLAVVGLLNAFAGGGGGSGLWLLFLGWFLVQAAQAESSSAYAREAFEGRRVVDLMSRNPATVSAGMPVGELFDVIVKDRGHSSYPVVDGDEVVGLVSLRQASSVAPGDRATRTVREVMLARDEVPLLTPETALSDAAEALGSEPRRALVMDDGRLVGLMSISDVARAIEAERSRSSRGPKRAGGLAWVVVAVTLTVAAALLYHPPLLVLEPGSTLDVSRDITITGVSTDEMEGQYLLTSVRLVRPSALGALVAWGTGREVVGLSQVLPEGTDAGDYFRQQREVFRESRLFAAAAAAEEAGLRVAIEGSGVVVENVLPGSPAAEALRPGDVIVGIDGDKVEIASELQDSVRARPAGTRFRLSVERGGDPRPLEHLVVRSASLSGAPEPVTGIGVLITTRDFDVDLPFEVQFRDRRIGGPSAGLAYALAITDMLQPADFARGIAVGATGTIDVDGRVGSVGGLQAKAQALEDADADLFLVPEQEIGEIDEGGVETKGVTDLRQAIDLLRG